ncbi:pentapeptide repeat-containing protein [Brunnivagina elsteri]|uniref:Pentapeptide repeat-containing protein n=1 Tax=Brunnivagina elsteri CCALA 953 TaxID=987040 RepID=A0A2A2TF28_9CYAN|nr:pentapeptide repeat-containing protein [Calothrix elsteri]PAX52323.1 hypothetical protein CK510_19985 [Calothrix elsteri CCALA 953]
MLNNKRKNKQIKAKLNTINEVINLIQKYLDKIWFRVLVSLGIACIAILATYLVEKWSQNQEICYSLEPIQKCIFRQILSVVTPSNIECFSILTGASIYILESRERRQRIIYQTWQVIDSASGVRVSYARIEALKTLKKYKISLQGIDLSNTDLSQIELEKVQLNGINFSNANLNSANLNSAELNGYIPVFILPRKINKS